MAETAIEEPEIKRKPSSKPRRPKPVELKKDPSPPTVPTFMQQQGKISKEDWGPRANIYLYRVEPVIDRTRGGDKKYIMCYQEPLNEDKILADHGSGRYKAVLNFKKPAANQGDEIDSYYFDILNLQYPPKIPQGEWTDDPRNRRWAWAKQKEPTPAPQPAPQTDFVEALRVGNEIRKSTMEEIKANQPQGSRVSEFKEFLIAAKELSPLPAAPPPPATENAVLNTVVTLFTKQLDAQAEQIKELRQELRDSHKAPTTSGLGTVTEMVNGLSTLLPKVKELFPELGAAVTSRGRMGPWMEFFQPVLPGIVDFLKPMGIVMATKLATQSGQPAQGSPHPAQTQTLPQGQTQPANQPAPIIQFLNVITPAVIRHLNEWLKDTANEAFSGRGLASSIDDLYGAKWNGLDWLTEARTAGAENIVAAYQQAPKLWEKLSQVEPQFRQFIQDFLAWTRPVDLETEEPEVADLSQGPVM